MPTEEEKKNYPGKWKQAQQSAQEVYGLEVGTEAHRVKSEQLFIELGGGCVDAQPGESAEGE
jgi:hypothetical protein